MANYCLVNVRDAHFNLEFTIVEQIADMQKKYSDVSNILQGHISSFILLSSLVTYSREHVVLSSFFIFSNR